MSLVNIMNPALGLRELVFWNSIHLEVASDPFCLLINSSWLLVFILYVFFTALRAQERKGKEDEEFFGHDIIILVSGWCFLSSESFCKYRILNSIIS